MKPTAPTTPEPTPPPAALDLATIHQHRADFAAALNAALAKRKQAETEIERCSGGVAALDMLIAKLTPAPAAAGQTKEKKP